jgi:hypothetical protein
MTRPLTNSVRAPQIPTVSDGQRVGELKVTESAGPRLRLVSDARSDLVLVVVGLVALGSFVVLVGRNLHPPAGAPPPGPMPWWIAWLPIIAFATLWVGLPGIGRSYLADGSSKSLTRRWLLFSRRLSREQIDSVYVKVFHEAGREQMSLGVSLTGRRKPVRLTKASTAQRQAAMVAVARHMADLLGVPLVLDGKPVEASDDVRQALDATVAKGALTTQSQPLLINCPRCGARGVPGLAYDYLERYNGVPVLKTTWVKCTACQTQLYSRQRAEELYGRSPDELAGVIIYRAPAAFVRNTFAVLALLLGIFPGVGLAVAIPAAILNWRQARCAKIASLVGLVCAILTTITVTVFMLTRP